MGEVTRKRYSADFKSRVALDAIKGGQPLAELSAKHGVHETMITAWKRPAIEGIAAAFGNKKEPVAAASEADLTPFARQNRATRCGTGFFGENLRSMSVDRRRELVDPTHEVLSIVRQCELLYVFRSSFYYAPRDESAENLAFPYYGSRQMARIFAARAIWWAGGGLGD